MTIKEFRTTPLPDGVVNALIGTTQAFSEMDVLLSEHPESSIVLSDILRIYDVYYSHFDSNLDINEICHSLYIPNGTGICGASIITTDACTTYVRHKSQINDVLTAGDLLKIDEAIKSKNTKPLSSEISILMDAKVNAVWSILHDLYALKRQYSLHLEAAIACYRLLTISETQTFCFPAQAILFSTIYQSDLVFHGLSRQWILSTDPRLQISEMPVENAIIHILNVFQQMWSYAATLVRTLNKKRIEITFAIQENLPQQVSVGFCELLAENLCIRNRDVSEKLQISNKTTIKYLLHLEQNAVLHSLKSGREKYYFNNLLLDLIKQYI